MTCAKRICQFAHVVSICVLMTAHSSSVFARLDQDAFRISPPDLSEKTTINLPAEVNQIQFAASGRFILFLFKAKREIGVFDVNSAKFVRSIPANEDDILFAGSATKIVTASATTKSISIFDLLTGERDSITTLNLKGTLHQMVVGSATNGPVILGCYESRLHRNLSYRFDLGTQKLKELGVPGRGGFARGHGLSISSNGKVIGSWSKRTTAGDMAYINTGDVWPVAQIDGNSGYCLPSPDGERVYTAGGIYTREMKSVQAGFKGIHPFPATQGRFYFVLSKSNTQDPYAHQEIKLHSQDQGLPLVKLRDVYPIEFRGGWHGDPSALTLNRQLMYIPAAKLMLQVRKDRKRMVLLPFDLQEELNRSGVDYLAVTSAPPTVVKAESDFAYQVDVLSNIGKFTFSLDIGPPGMKVNEKGLVTWKPDKKSSALNFVQLSITDTAGQQTVHSFDLFVDGGSGNAIANEPRAKNGGVVSVPKPAAKSAVANNAMAIPRLDRGPVEYRKYNGPDSQLVRIPAAAADMIVAGSGRYVLLHFPAVKKVGLFDIAEAAFTHYFPAPDPNTVIAAGLNHLLVFSPGTSTVARFNLETRELETNRSIPFAGSIVDAVMGSGSMGPVMLRIASGTERHSQTRIEFMDLGTLKPLELRWEKNRQPGSLLRELKAMRAAANGSLFGIESKALYRIEDGKLVSESVYELQSGRDRKIIPRGDGKAFMYSDRVYTEDRRLVGSRSTTSNRSDVLIPAVNANLYIRHLVFPPMTRGGKRIPTSVLCAWDDSEPLISIQNMDRPKISTSWDRPYPKLTEDRCTVFVPMLNALVFLDRKSDSLSVRKFDVEEKLRGSNRNYLVVLSAPTTFAYSGETWKYPIEVASNANDIRYRVESGPRGMKVSQDGLVEWKVPRKPKRPEEGVIIEISRRRGEKEFHSFSILLPDVKAALEAARNEKIAANRRKAERQRLEDELRKKEIADKQKAKSRRETLMRQRRELAAAKKAKPSPGEKNTAKSRRWVSADGKYSMTGSFLRIEDRTTVILLATTGKEVRIPLLKLRDEDIFEAVSLDLTDSRKSPFEMNEAAPNPFENDEK